MTVNLRYPNITGATPQQQLTQLQSYLHQMVDQLNVALLDSTGAPAAAVKTATAASTVENGKTAQSSFNEIKALIIKSADIVNAYYEEMDEKFSGSYVAQSDFGTYAQETEQAIRTNAEGIEQLFSNVQSIDTDIVQLEQRLLATDAYINSGLLYYDGSGAPVYGLEVGQRNTVNGVEVFNKYARFTAAKLSFYDANGNEVAYVSDRKLYIGQAEITVSLLMGGYEDTVTADGGVVTRWIG